MRPFDTATHRYAAVAALTALFIVAVYLVMISAGPMYTSDAWWHLATGEVYAHHGPWIAHDPLLFTGRPGGPVPHEWLFSVALWELKTLTGFMGLRVLHGALAALAVWLAWSLARRETGDITAACLAATVFALVATPRLSQLRPDLVSIPFTLLGYRLLVERDGAPTALRRSLFLAMMLVWVNAHSLFLVGLNMLLAAVLGVLLRAGLRHLCRERNAARVRDDLRLARNLAGLLGLALLITLLNPRGFEQHLQFLHSSEHSAMWRINDEWAHLDPLSSKPTDTALSLLAWSTNDAVLGLFALCTLAGAWRYARARDEDGVRALDPVLLGQGMAAAVAMLVAVRFAWMEVFPMLYVLRALYRPRGSPHLAWPRLAWPRLRTPLLAVVTVMLALRMPFEMVIATVVARFGTDPGAWFTMPYRTHKFYAEGVYFLQETGLSGNLYNSYWMGGFLGYWRAPRLRTFIDGRTEHYSIAVFRDHMLIRNRGIEHDGSTYLQVLDRRHVDVFFGVGFPGWWYPVNTTTALEGDKNWVMVSRSFRSAIYVRRNARNRRNLERVAAWYAAQHVPYDPLHGVDPGAVIHARPGWAAAHLLLTPDWRTLLSDYASKNTERVRRAGAKLCVELLLDGAYAEAVAVSRRLLALDPADDMARTRLVFGLMHTGDLNGAVAAAKVLVKHRPRDPVSRHWLEEARRYRALMAKVKPGVYDRTWIAAAKMLTASLPASTAETWEIEREMPTESFTLVRAKR